MKLEQTVLIQIGQFLDRIFRDGWDLILSLRKSLIKIISVFRCHLKMLITYLVMFNLRNCLLLNNSYLSRKEVTVPLLLEWKSLLSSYDFSSVWIMVQKYCIYTIRMCTAVYISLHIFKRYIPRKRIPGKRSVRLMVLMHMCFARSSLRFFNKRRQNLEVLSLVSQLGSCTHQFCSELLLKSVVKTCSHGYFCF